MESFVASERAQRWWAALLGSPLLLLGCAHDKSAEPRVAEPLVVPDVQPREVAYIPPPPPTSTGVLVISESVRQKCNLPQTPSASPQFDFEQADLRERGKDILDRIANCMTEGSLQDQSITVVGHADPRGPEAYNLDLGMERARAARDYLRKRGVAMSSVQLESRGEAEAAGSNPESWQLDRRVEIEESGDASR